MVVVVALVVPLALNLQGRAEAELEARALAQAQSFSSALSGNIAPTPRLRLAAAQAADQAEGRVTIVGPRGVVVVDTQRPDVVGTDYATPGRPEIVAALDRRPTSEVRSSAELGRDILATAVPIVSDGRVKGAVRITQSTQGVTRAANRALLGVVAIGVAGLVGGLVLAWVLAGSLSRPLRRLADAARRLGSGDLSARTQGIRGAREVEELARSFDDMAVHMEATVRAQREFAANASHQLRTPLAGMKLRLESAAAAELPPGARRDVEAAEAEVDRLAGIVERLLSTARRTEASTVAEFDLGEAREEAIERWREPAAGAGAALSGRGAGGRAVGARGDVDQILDALIDNAIAYAPGPIVVEAGVDDGWGVLAVEDSGPGVPAEQAGRITERFYRAPGAAPGGSGLGLAIAHELAERWGGTLGVAPGPRGGLRAEVRLPAAPDGAP